MLIHAAQIVSVTDDDDGCARGRCRAPGLERFGLPLEWRYKTLRGVRITPGTHAIIATRRISERDGAPYLEVRSVLPVVGNGRLLNVLIDGEVARSDRSGSEGSDAVDAVGAGR